MKITTIAILSISAVLLGVLAVATLGPEGAGANSLLPPVGRTGAPGDAGTCITCHTGATGTPDGGLVVFPLNAVTEYVPGDTVTIAIAITDPDEARWGFELTALKDSNNSMAGTLTGQTTLTGSQSSGGKTYISQTSNGVTQALQPNDGTYWGLGGGFWTVLWTAPPPGAGDVTIYAAGVAADSSKTANASDVTYTSSVTLTEKIGTPVSNTTWGKIKNRYH